MDLADAIDYFLMAKQAEGLTARTVENYGAQLMRFARWAEDATGRDLDVTEVKVPLVRQYIADLLRRKQMGDISSATVAAAVRHLKVFTRFAAKESEGLLDRDPFRDLKVPKVEGKLHDIVSNEDVQRLLAATDLTTHEGRRDYAIVCFLLDTGVRVGELCNLKHADLDIKGRSAVVYGKGRRQRTVFFSAVTAVALTRYTSRMPAKYRAEWLWTSLRRNVGGRITENGVGQMLRRLGQKSGVGSRVNPHTFRHTFATNYLRAGGDLNSLMRLMGHADLTVLQTYLNLVTDDLRDKHEQFSPMARVMGMQRR